MDTAIRHPSLVPFEGAFDLGAMPTAPPKKGVGKKEYEERLEDAVRELARQQQLLYAQNSNAVLILFQGMDTSGKDGTIRAVLSGVNPAGCQVYSFKRPSEEELDHDFLWRTASRMPERGRLGVFNRSYYEEVLVARVHPNILLNQRIPGVASLAELDRVWSERYDSIREHERHMARNGTVILKFWLHLSREEQGRRLMDRLDDENRNWKFELGDLDEREHWFAYQDAAEKALAATSRPWAPWYCIPADDKLSMRVLVAEILAETLRRLDLAVPTVSPEQRAKLVAARARLVAKG